MKVQQNHRVAGILSASMSEPRAAASESVPPRDEIAALRTIVEGTARSTGTEFFESLVRNLAAALDVRYAFVAEFAGQHRARTLAYWCDDRMAENVEWDVRGTPC